MALAVARVIVAVELLARDGPVATGVILPFAFLVDVFGAAHEICG
jgi:hypothetical protein